MPCNNVMHIHVGFQFDYTLPLQLGLFRGDKNCGTDGFLLEYIETI